MHRMPATWHSVVYTVPYPWSWGPRTQGGPVRCGVHCLLAVTVRLGPSASPWSFGTCPGRQVQGPGTKGSRHRSLRDHEKPPIPFEFREQARHYAEAGVAALKRALEI